MQGESKFPFLRGIHHTRETNYFIHLANIQMSIWLLVFVCLFSQISSNIPCILSFPKAQKIPQTQTLFLLPTATPVSIVKTHNTERAPVFPGSQIIGVLPSCF